MITGYTYELWNGKKAIGTWTSLSPIIGKYVTFPTISELKREYGRHYETIEVPIMYRVINDNGVDYIVRRCLDVRRKSKRQRELIMQRPSCF